MMALYVSHEMQFDSVDALKAQLKAADGNQVQEDYSGAGWVVCASENPKGYVLYGLTGDESVYYALIGTDAEGNTMEPAELKALHDTMLL